MKLSKQKRLPLNEKIIQVISNNNEIRIKDLAKSLGMWDSNLRKKIKVLVEEGKIEVFQKDKYKCVRVKIK